MRVMRLQLCVVALLACAYSATVSVVADGGGDELTVPGTITPAFFSPEAEILPTNATTNTTTQDDGTETAGSGGPMTADVNSTVVTGSPSAAIETAAPGSVTPPPTPTVTPSSSAPQLEPSPTVPITVLPATAPPTTAPPTPTPTTVEPPTTRPPVPTPAPTTSDSTESPSPPAPMRPEATPSATVPASPAPAEPESPNPPRPQTPAPTSAPTSASPTSAPSPVTPAASATPKPSPTQSPQPAKTLKPGSSDGSSDAGGVGRTTTPSVIQTAAPTKGGSTVKPDITASPSATTPLSPAPAPEPSTKQVPVSNVDIEAIKLPQQAEATDSTSQQDASFRNGNGEISAGSVASVLGIVFGACGVLVLTLCVINTRRVRKTGEVFSPVP